MGKPFYKQSFSVLSVALLLLLFGGFTLSAATANPGFFAPVRSALASSTDSQYFPQTKHTVEGKFWVYWQANGGLAHFGYPLTEAQNETDPQTGKTFLTQWFERSRFELHPELAGTPFEIEQGLLGSELNKEASQVDANFIRTVPLRNTFTSYDQDFEYIPETGHNISGYFLKYWLENGGVAQFGFPISEEYGTTNLNGGKTLQIQWFERARFEFHPELLPPPPTAQSLPPRNSTAMPGATATPVLSMSGGTTPVAVRTPPMGPVATAERTADTQIPPTVIGPPPSATQLPGQPILLGLLGDEIKAPYLLPANPDPKFVWQIGKVNYSDYNFPYSLALDSQGNIFSSDSSNGHVVKYTPDGQIQAKWIIDPNSNPASGAHPAAITIDNQDNVYVANSGDSYIYKFDPKGKLSLKWGGKGSQDGQLSGPKGLSVDNQGNIYVADTDNNRVQKFDNQGHFLSKWGSLGGNDGQFIAPQAVVPDNQGHVFVADTEDNLVEKFDTDGHFIKKWGGYSTAPGKFKAPRDLEIYIDPTNSRNSFLYTLETSDNYTDGNYRIQKFDLDGNYIASLGGFGFGDSQFRRPQGLAVSKKDGSVYVGDAGTQIKKFDANGQFQARFNTFSTGNNQFLNPVGVTTDKQFNIYVTDTGNARIQKFDQYGHFLLSFGSYGHSGSNGQFDYPVGIAVDAQGNIFVSDNNSGRIQKFDSAGHFLLGWGSVGQGDGQFKLPPPPDPKKNVYAASAIVLCGLAVDTVGNVYVADTGNNRVQKFDNQGHFLDKWKLDKYYGNGPNSIYTPVGSFPAPQGPTDLAIDANNNVYVVSTLETPVLKFDAKGNLDTKWNATGNPTIQKPFYDIASGVAVDSSGDVYIDDVQGGGITKYSGVDGHFIKRWGEFNNQYSLVSAPFEGLAINAEGDLLIVDFIQNNLTKFRLPLATATP